MLCVPEEACEGGQFKCAEGVRCVPAAWRCDGRVHCADASDELDCSEYRTRLHATRHSQAKSTFSRVSIHNHYVVTVRLVTFIWRNR